MEKQEQVPSFHPKQQKTENMWNRDLQGTVIR